MPEDGQYKFDNCTHRSIETRTTLIRRCACHGGDYEDTGYDCNARSIFKITPEICQYCWVFEDKSKKEN